MPRSQLWERQTRNEGNLKSTNDEHRGVPFAYQWRQQEPPVQTKSVWKRDNFHIYGHFEHVIIPQLLIKMYVLTLNYAESFHYNRVLQFYIFEQT